MTNTGSATIVCGPGGEPLKPLFIPKGYSNGGHASFVARQGLMIVDAGHDRGGERATISQVVKIGTDDGTDPDKLILQELFNYENGDGNVPEYLQAAVDAALAKSSCYHCREPHFVLRGQ